MNNLIDFEGYGSIDLRNARRVLPQYFELGACIISIIPNIVFIHYREAVAIAIEEGKEEEKRAHHNGKPFYC
ncbi:MAG: hypothetical protein AAF193_01435 [Bacteroidota bacterium]